MPRNAGYPNDLVEQVMARHDRFGEQLHAYLPWTPDQARGVAGAADAAFAAGAVAGPLQGIPVSIKDSQRESQYREFLEDPGLALLQVPSWRSCWGWSAEDRTGGSSPIVCDGSGDKLGIVWRHFH